MLSQRLKLARRHSGLSLRDLSSAMDGIVSAQAIGKCERAEMTSSTNRIFHPVTVRSRSWPPLTPPPDNP